MKMVKAAASVSAKSRKKAGLSPKVSHSGGDNFPVVCLGGSAGSLKACAAVVREIPLDAGMAVVVVSHLRRAPTNLPQILARHTTMPVDLITSGLKLRPNRVYVIPSGRELTVRDGAFHLSPMAEKSGWPTVITVLLESLARQWKGKTIAVILSGLDSDGVKALPAIKAAGGITFAQKIDTAEQQSMPRQAVETGFVDFELTPIEIGRELARIARAEAISPAGSKATDFPIAGVGASAGGLEAFTQLLDHLPAHTGMAFVLVQHLDPTHESQLTEILSRKSAMPVSEVSGPTQVEADHVNVIPAGKNLTISGGILQTVPRPETGARNMPIDDFLQALGKDRQNGAFAVILSGTASDGTLGARAIKVEGGITFAQEPSSAKFEGMPRSAIASGSVDFVLTPEGIAKQLTELAGHSYPHALREQVSASATTDARDLNRIFVRLRAATAIDFTYYKHNTILRRIKRRMALHGIEGLDQYARRVEQDRAEAIALAQDFLVNVTSFFREPDALGMMREIIFPTWLERKSPDDPIRIWIPGCSTGEEAYSLAIALMEFLDEHAVHSGIQIFATDLSESVIEKARAGLYLENAVSGVSPARLERFFVKRDRVYQVSQAVRDLCVFARHDVTRDPPFSKMDLISCCNLLIYLGSVLQKRALSLFHYALKPNGFLVLGSSESVGAFPESFETIDRKYKIYSKKGTSSRLNLDSLPESLTRDLATRPRIPGESPGTGSIIQKEAERMLLAEYAPASVIIDDAMHVLQVRGQTDAYLQVPQGAPTTHLTPMVRPGLLAGLKTAVEQARKQNAPVSEKGLRVKENGNFRMVDLRVSPIRGLQDGDRCFLVLFEDSAADKKPTQKHARKNGKPGKAHARSQAGELAMERLQEEIARLEYELTGTREYLQSIIEIQESAAEELRSANEEAQANNEELDTAKEELQASNEELTTVNEELRIRNAEQNSSNSDLRKLLESINVPLVMVGKDLRIRWFTAAMEPVLNLLPNDQGRLITDLHSTLIPDFMEMLVRALAGSQEKSVEFQRPGGGWLSLRILPYEGPENTIDGAIATLIDIDDLKRARDFAEAVVQTVREPLVVLDANLHVRTANDAFYRIFQLQKQETEGRPFYELGNGQWDIPKLRQLLEDLLPKQSSLRDFEVEHRAVDKAGPKTMMLNAREIRQQDGERMILLAIDDITELRRSTEDLRRTNDDLTQFIFAASHDLKEPLRMIVAHTQLLADSYAGKLDSKGALSMRYAVEGALRLEALISGLREFWELSERAEEKRTLVDCNDVLKKVLLNLEASIAETKAKITSDPLPSLMASEATLIQLFQNLLANALKYRSEEPPIVHISAFRKGAEWVFSVRDNGIGIDAQYARQIFGVFKRLHPPNKYPGTGIGLAICQKIVERYGGRIWLESLPGQGSEFRFAIPS
jgi:two-component system, chemotaxis family, CheB/CheR fusion protein